jgi:hypothetical protein
MRSLPSVPILPIKYVEPNGDGTGRWKAREIDLCVVFGPSFELEGVSRESGDGAFGRTRTEGGIVAGSCTAVDAFGFGQRSSDEWCGREHRYGTLRSNGSISGRVAGVFRPRRRGAAILLTGGPKKRQQRDITAAIELWAAYNGRRRRAAVMEAHATDAKL